MNKVLFTEKVFDWINNNSHNNNNNNNNNVVLTYRPIERNTKMCRLVVPISSPTELFFLTSPHERLVDLIHPNLHPSTSNRSQWRSG